MINLEKGTNPKIVALYLCLFLKPTIQCATKTQNTFIRLSILSGWSVGFHFAGTCKIGSVVTSVFPSEPPKGNQPKKHMPLTPMLVRISSGWTPETCWCSAGNEGMNLGIPRKPPVGWFLGSFHFSFSASLALASPSARSESSESSEGRGAAGAEARSSAAAAAAAAGAPAPQARLREGFRELGEGSKGGRPARDESFNREPRKKKRKKKKKKHPT